MRYLRERGGGCIFKYLAKKIFVVKNFGVHCDHSVNNLTCDNMTMTVHHDLGVPLPESAGDGVFDFAEVVRAAAKTVELLEENGLDTSFDDFREAEATADMLAQSYAADPEATSKAAKPTNVAKLTPQSLVLTRDILDEFGQQVVTRSVEIRHLVTNKLILESENPDARIRMRALELLGKITDVGLFTERSEVTITHQSTDDLKNLLRDKLNRLKSIGASSTADVGEGEFDVIDGEIVPEDAETEENS